jgi:hypothetical protein
MTLGYINRSIIVKKTGAIAPTVFRIKASATKHRECIERETPGAAVKRQE